jgi:predicted metal-dependent phosphotriesterase family hydrolase
MGHVQTILGDIAPKDMGITDPHAHLICVGGLEVMKDLDFLLDSVDKAAEEAGYFAAVGGCTVVEMNPPGCGRNILKMLELAQRVPLHIIATTGFQKSEFYDTYAHWLVTCSVEQIAEMLIAEVTEGMDAHDYNGPIVERIAARAGVIKAATGYGMITDFERKAFHAVALAHKETGAPISTHTEAGTMALEQLEMLKAHGVNLERVIVGHVQRNPDIWYHKKLLATGATLQYDGGYRVKYYPDSTMVDLIFAVVKAGYQKQLLLATDAGRATYQKAHGGGPGMDYILKVFVPRLREEGLQEAVIEDILVNNPARLFTIEK